MPGVPSEVDGDAADKIAATDSASSITGACATRTYRRVASRYHLFCRPHVIAGDDCRQPLPMLILC